MQYVWLCIVYMRLRSFGDYCCKIVYLFHSYVSLMWSLGTTKWPVPFKTQPEFWLLMIPWGWVRNCIKLSDKQFFINLRPTSFSDISHGSEVVYSSDACGLGEFSAQSQSYFPILWTKLSSLAQCRLFVHLLYLILAKR